MRNEFNARQVISTQRSAYTGIDSNVPSTSGFEHQSTFESHMFGTYVEKHRVGKVHHNLPPKSETKQLPVGGGRSNPAVVASTGRNTRSDGKRSFQDSDSKDVFKRRRARSFSSQRSMSPSDNDTLQPSMA